MALKNNYILTINGGSSSIRFAYYKYGKNNIREFNGKIERIGLKDTQLTFFINALSEGESQNIKNNDYTSAIKFLLDFLNSRKDIENIVAIGHRIVHGMNHIGPEIITPGLLEELKQLELFDPEHIQGELALIKAFSSRYPTLPQIACFDTAFHQTIPALARILPIPRRFYNTGVKKYGFHGLSYSYLLEELKRISETEALNGKLIFAHLGNGASLAAIENGKCVDTTMGFTPAGGIPMSSRSGDLDPGLVLYLMKTEKLTPEEFNHMIHSESGILGVSETSSDMRDLLELEASDKKASDAINMFCYAVKKNIGAFTSILKGLDTLVFTGGIGENAPEIRKRICEGLEFMGIELDTKNNLQNKDLISCINSRVKIRIIQTDEESMIAKMTYDLLKK